MSSPKEKIARNEEILKDRNERSMTHLQIAEKHNISTARVKQILEWIKKKQNRGN
jgi:hypothetical protein